MSDTASINKDDLAAAVAAAHPELLKTKKAAAEVIDSVLGAVSSALKEGTEVRIFGFGSFQKESVSARTGRNPRTGEEIQIPAGTKVKFKAAKALKDAAA